MTSAHDLFVEAEQWHQEAIGYQLKADLATNTEVRKGYRDLEAACFKHEKTLLEEADLRMEEADKTPE